MKVVASVATVYLFVIYMPPSQGSAHILVSALVQRGVSCTVTFVLSVTRIALRRTDNRNLPFLFLEVQRGPASEDTLHQRKLIKRVISCFTKIHPTLLALVNEVLEGAVSWISRFQVDFHCLFLNRGRYFNSL